MSKWVFFPSHSHSKSFTLENRWLQCSWRLTGPLRSPGSPRRRRRPLWAGNKPCLPPSGSLPCEFSTPCSTKFTRHRQTLLMRHTKLFPGFPHDRMLNEKLRATCTVCYHSICLRPQTGHYPAIIFPDLQSRVEEAIARACSPLGGTDGNQLENLHLHDPAEQLIRSGYLFST